MSFISRNVKIILFTQIGCGFALGLFNFIFPFYLDSRGFSLVEMGLVFSLAALVVSLLSIFVGEYTDVHGRKAFYSFSTLLWAISTSLFPFASGLLDTAVFKMFSDFATRIKQSFPAVMLYDNIKEG